MSSNDWNLLHAELDRWGELGRTASLWCRDDDAFAPSSSLERLVRLGQQFGVSISLAVIPEPAQAEFASWLARFENVQVLVHGFAHRNHAPAGQKKAEFGAHRSLSAMVTEITHAWERIRSLFEARAIPAFVPPWNRISDTVVRELSGCGLQGVSTFRPRVARLGAPGLHQTNCHVDIIDWKGGRGFVGDELALRRLTGHLSARRYAMIDTEEPTGVLSHHKDNDEGCWQFLERLWGRTCTHPAARWLPAYDAVLAA